MPTFNPPSKTVGQTLVWTALPQGYSPVSGKVRISAFVSPQLSFSETVGYRSETSTELATYPDWVNWPETVANPSAPITFQVAFSTLTHTQYIEVTPDLSVLQPTYWAAMFGADTTRVDSYGPEDFTQAKPISFSTLDAHTTVTGTYNAFASNSATTLASAAQNPSEFVDPSSFSLHLLGDPAGLKTVGGLSDAVSALNASKVPANVAAATVLSPPAPLQSALAFHAAPVNNTAIPAQTVPVLDFHQAITSLGNFPELLRYFGLLFPLEVELPTNYNESTVFTIAVIANWTSLGASVPTQDVPLATVCSLAGGNFLSAPDPSASDKVYAQGALTLGDTATFSLVDVDVDRAAHSLNSLSLNLHSTLALHAAESVVLPGTPPATTSLPAGTTLPYVLPALRGAGLSLIWSGFGQVGQGLNALAQRQLNLSQSIANWVGSHPYLRPTSPETVLYTEDLTRGWRVDVLDTANNNKNWKSLHWRQASYVFGEAGGTQITVNETTPMEGMVSPAASHAPTTDGSIPSEIYVHEMITRWVGWSLSAPRPGGQVNDDGTVSATAVGNPAVPTSYTDEYGNHNPQISATFATAPGAVAVTDPVTGLAIGETGLPVLRFGHTYKMAARAVDLGGWSIPQGHALSTSAPITHARWEPIKAPITLPVAPLTSGEGVHTVVVRQDDVNRPTPNGRWLFPPRVPEVLAEEHGALDVNGIPAKARYTQLAKYNDGSPDTLDGSEEDTTAGGRNLILPTTLPTTISTGTTVGRPAITWLSDPASYGYALAFEPPPGIGSIDEATAILAAPYTGALPFTAFNSDLPGIGTSAVFTDAWIDASDPAWPAVAGKMLMLVPVARTSGVERLSSGVIVPRLVSNSKSTDSPDLAALEVTPGSVYQVRLSSIFPYAFTQVTPTTNVLGLLPEVVAGIKGLNESIVAKDRQLNAILQGQIPQITPYHTLQLVYAVLIPLVKPAFSTGSTGVQFLRQPDGITVAITDLKYVVDIPTTESVTYTATWIDPYDNPADPTNNPGTDTKSVAQGGLVATVGNIYTDAIAQDPMVPVAPAQAGTTPPFGTVTPTGEDGGVFAATHRIGDTKHHYVTYTPRAATRFGAFFQTTTTLSLFGTTPAVVDARGIDVNFTSVRIASSGELLDPGNYTLDAAAGTIALVRLKYVEFGHPNPPYQDTPLTVTYTPTDTLLGEPFHVHIPSTTAPPPIKVAKVAPSWSISTTGSAPGSSYRYTRTGNTLRVYLERPWYVTGANEMVGVLSAFIRSGSSIDNAVLASVNIDDVSLMALDPINIGHPGGNYSQSQLGFVTPTDVPSAGGHITGTFPLIGGNPVRVPSPLDPSAENYNIWGYEPQYDAVSGLWYADIQLNMDVFAESPPPGYFLRLALARFQPYSIGQLNNADPTDNRFLSGTTLVTVAQPVPDRQVTVVSGETGTLDVTVTGPGYYGFRPAPENPTDGWVHDSYNEYALHPYSDNKGAKSTSTMIVELEQYDDSSGFSGDFGWSTVPQYIFQLVPEFDGSPIVTWKNDTTKPVQLPPFTNLSTVRLKVTELDYFQTANGTPAKVNTLYRRTFIAHIPL